MQFEQKRAEKKRWRVCELANDILLAEKAEWFVCQVNVNGV